MSILVVAEHRQRQVREVTAELVTAAASLGEAVVLAVIADHLDDLRIGYAGVEELVHVRVDSAEFEPDVYLEAVASLVDERAPRATFLPFTVNSMSYAAALAVRSCAGFASDVHAIRLEDGRLVVTRSFYGGKVYGDVELREHSVVVLRTGVWPAAAAAPAAEATEVAGPAAQTRVRHAGFVDPPAGDADIASADVILAVGRGIGDRENLALFEELAPKLGAALAVSRPLVDAGWVTSARQVGQSGRTVKPRVYLAFGISGAVQHVAGMRGSGRIIAVNSDPDAAIFTVADYGAVADLLDVAEELDRIS